MPGRRTLFSFLRHGTSPPRPSSGSGGWRLLMQLAVVSLVVISAVGAVLTWRLTTHLSRSAVGQASHNTQANLVPRVSRQLGEQDLTAPMTGQRYTEFQRFLEESGIADNTLRVRLWSRDGTVLYSDDRGEVGTSRPLEGDLAEALAGGTGAHLGTEDTPELASEGQVLEVYAPLLLPGSDQAVGVLEVYEDATDLAEHLSAMRYNIFGGLGIGLAVYYVLLLVVVRSGVRVIRQQQEKEASEARARETVRAVVAALDLRDTETEHHATRVAEMSVAIARQIGVAPGELADIEIGALLHDVGKIGVPDQVLRKPGPLTEQEWASMRRHPDLGYHMLNRFPNLQAAALLVHAHHEHFDGSGYPLGLAGEEIPLPARIFAVADAYDAITSDRPYRAARSHHEALAEIRRCAGSQFDPEVVRAFLAIADRFWRPASSVEPIEEADKATQDMVFPRAA